VDVSTDKIKEFCEKTGFVISPYHPADEYAAKMMKAGHCLCDAKRLNCPCELCEEEVKRDGTCKCSFFMTKEMFEKVNARRNMFVEKVTTG